MNRIRTITLLLLLLGTAKLSLAQAPVARVGDVTRLQGQGTNHLIGYGLVTGLQGTGDGSKFLNTSRRLAAMMQRFNDEVESLDDVAGSKNVAMVMVEVVIPEHGAREGDRLQVSVSAVAAKSLVGGRLLPTPLVYHDRNVERLFGFAQGAIVVEGETSTVGVIRAGARMEQDVLMTVVVDGSVLHQTGFRNPWIKSGQDYITLVLDEAHAGWSMAAAVAQAVDKELGVSADVDRVALAMDSRNIVVLVPEHQRGDITSWIRDVEQTPILMESNEARVTINRKTGTVVITGDTRISPVIISQKGLTVTVAAPGPDGTTPQPAFQQQDFVPLDVEARRQPNVRDLLEALNRLKVSAADRISILEEIHRAGKLHAQLLYEG